MFFPWVFFPSYLHNLGIFLHQVILPTPQILWRLRPRHAGRATLDPICYESTNILIFLVKDFLVQGFSVFFFLGGPKFWDRIFGESMLLVTHFFFPVLHAFMVRWKGRGEQRAVWRAVFPSLCCSMPLSSVVHDPRVFCQKVLRHSSELRPTFKCALKYSRLNRQRCWLRRQLSNYSWQDIALEKTKQRTREKEVYIVCKKFSQCRQVPIVGWLQILVVIALSELWRYENVISKYSDLMWQETTSVFFTDGWKGLKCI